MQRERQGRNDLFAAGDPFVNFQGFGMMPGLFGGRDPFDDPFFTRPFGSMLGSGRFDPPSSTSREVSQTNRGKTLVIEELSSDDEGEKKMCKLGMRRVIIKNTLVQTKSLLLSILMIILMTGKTGL